MLLHILARGKIGRTSEAELVDRYLKRIAWPTRVSELPDRGGTVLDGHRLEQGVDRGPAGVALRPVGQPQPDRGLVGPVGAPQPASYARHEVDPAPSRSPAG